MPFNSYLFVLLFLPVSLALYYAVSLTRLHRARLPLLIVITLVFYAKAALQHLPILLGSIVFNYVCARMIAASDGRRRRVILTIGVTVNVLALVFYKYTGFLVGSLDAITGSHIAIPHILLPLAISFYTFQQIAFLVDTSRGLVQPTRPLGYASSILFFPFIISGPITFYREIGPQLERRPQAHAVLSNILIGSVLFALGLFKKSVIADSFSLWVDPIFAAATAGKSVGADAAWGGASAYLLQIYYDFSGYSDMAMGTARMLGILLPLNFFSPIRCTSIIDYWRRWHITLGRFVNGYIFQPISVPLSRWAAGRGMGRKGMLIVGTLVPTLLTMLIIGAWHGGNWTFVVFGLLHGIYMVTNEAFRFATRKRRKGKSVTRGQIAAGNILTMVAVVFAIVAFRSDTMSVAGHVWADMTGVHGAGYFAWPVLQPLGGYGLLLALVPGFLLAYVMPNSQQLLQRFEPSLEWSKWRDMSLPLVRLEWRPRLGWGLVIGMVLLIGFAFIGRGSTNFVYFGF